MSNPSDPKVEITLDMVTELIAEQFSQWRHLSIVPVEFSGIDNRTFRLGEDMLIRLPSAKGYAEQAQKEQQWLPKLASCLSLQIPEPLAMGRPSKTYPWNWSVYKWIVGDSANTLSIDDGSLNDIAQSLAVFLNELHNIPASDGPAAGTHNYYRGAHPSVYDANIRSDVNKLRNIIDADAVIAVWDKALSSQWQNNPVWIHGDFSSGNIIIKDEKLTAIIDFGCMGVGDPACDLVIAWTYLKDESRKIFKSCLNLDEDTWARARGWALWKACFELASIENKTSPGAAKQQQIINDILLDN